MNDANAAPEKQPAGESQPSADGTDKDAATAVLEYLETLRASAQEHDQFLALLQRHGITRIDPMGQQFDPNLHQAVMKRTAADRPPNTIVEVLEHGYTIHDRVLRPARVVVSVLPE